MTTKRKDSVYQRAIYLTSKPGFRAGIASIRENFSLPSHGFDSEQKLEEWREKHVYHRIVDEADDIESNIDLAVARLISEPKYGISAGWHSAIKQFLFLNDVDKMNLPVGIGSKLVTDELTGKLVIQITISDDTSQQDYLNEWDNIEHARKLWGLSSPKHRRQADSFKLKRKKLAYDTWVKTGSYPKTADIIEKAFPDKYNSDVYTADDAKTDVQNFIKQAGI